MSDFYSASPEWLGYVCAELKNGSTRTDYFLTFKQRVAFAVELSIHVYSPGAGRNPLLFQLQYHSVSIVLCCKFSPLNDCNRFPHSNI